MYEMYDIMTLPANQHQSFEQSTGNHVEARTLNKSVMLILT